jgi:hypothetical protein
MGPRLMRGDARCCDWNFEAGDAPMASKDLLGVGEHGSCDRGIGVGRAGDALLATDDADAVIAVVDGGDDGCCCCCCWCCWCCSEDADSEFDGAPNNNRRDDRRDGVTRIQLQSGAT